MFHSCQHNHAENNLVVDCVMGVWDCNAAAGRPGNETMLPFRKGHRITRNVFMLGRQKPTLYLIHGYDPMVWLEADYNVICTEPVPPCPRSASARPTPTTRPMPLDRWRKDGFDVHSVHADPLLMDKEGEDYRLRPESPAPGARLCADTRGTDWNKKTMTNVQ